MRIVYYSKPYFTDCDFPLIKEMQTRGVDVRYYLPVGHRFQKKSILDLETPICKWGIYKASKIKGMEKYKDCLNLDNMYFICGKNKKWWPMSWLLWFGVFIHILFYRAEILHITWQLCGFDKFLLKFNLKKQQFFSRERGRSPFPLDGKFCTFVAPKFPNKKVTKWHK